MAATELHGVDGVRAAVGSHLGYSDWLEIDQGRVNGFADATHDHQWIHVDVDRATNGPFGAPIAHGYLTLSLSNLFLPQIVDVQGFTMGVNYGTGKVRYPAPVKVGDRIRGGARITEVVDVPGGVQATVLITIEIEGQEKPACTIESLSRYVL